MSEEFSIQRIPHTDRYRITHTRTDARVATCYDYAHAVFVRDALNTLEALYQDYLRNLANCEGSFVRQSSGMDVLASPESWCCTEGKAQGVQVCAQCAAASRDFNSRDL